MTSVKERLCVSAESGVRKRQVELIGRTEPDQTLI